MSAYTVIMESLLQAAFHYIPIPCNRLSISNIKLTCKPTRSIGFWGRKCLINNIGLSSNLLPFYIRTEIAPTKTNNKSTKADKTIMAIILLFIFWFLVNKIRCDWDLGDLQHFQLDTPRKTPIWRWSTNSWKHFFNHSHYITKKKNSTTLILFYLFIYF